nr:MAG TPA: PcfJ like protein [Caudoviricetes sp.]
MRIPKKVRELPWPEPYTGGENIHFRVTVQQPVADGERLLVVTFTMNEARRNMLRWTNIHRKDLRLVCSKQKATAAVLVRGDRSFRRVDLSAALYAASGARAEYCYPEISEAHEAALIRWLGVKDETRNHRMPELAHWVEEAITAEELAEKKRRGEILDEDAALCPEELPEGLVDYIQRVVLEEDRVLLYKKGGWRGTCFCCRQEVRALDASDRFAQGRIGYCPACGMKVRHVLAGGALYAADSVENVVTLQRGREDGVLFLREWRLERDPTAQWEDIPRWLKETARWMLRGSHVAKWQREEKCKVSMMRTERVPLEDWTRIRSVTEVYDGGYYFYLPENWKQLVAETPLAYCPLPDFLGETEKRKCRTHIMRMIVDWPRYPAVEKFYKAGYVPLVEAREHSTAALRNAVKWQASSIDGALRFPRRLLKLCAPKDWTVERMKTMQSLWSRVADGRFREAEIEPFLDSGMDLNKVGAALGFAPVGRIAAWLDRQRALEKGRFDREEQERREAAKKGAAYYSRSFRDNTEEIFRDYLMDCVTLGLDMHDREVLLPKDLNAAHRRTIAQVKHRANEAKRAAFHKQSEKLEKWRYEKGGLLIRPAADADELIAEGASLHHCVGGYADRMADGETAIFFVRRSDAPEEPYYTLELRNRSVVQCRTLHNASYEANQTVHDFVTEWLRDVVHGKNKQKTNKEDAA